LIEFIPLFSNSHQMTFNKTFLYIHKFSISMEKINFIYDFMSSFWNKIYYLKNKLWTNNKIEIYLCFFQARSLFTDKYFIFAEKLFLEASIVNQVCLINESYYSSIIIWVNIVEKNLYSERIIQCNPFWILLYLILSFWWRWNIFDFIFIFIQMKLWIIILISSDGNKINIIDNISWQIKRSCEILEIISQTLLF
jgi:hypothetical protein